LKQYFDGKMDLIQRAVSQAQFVLFKSRHLYKGAQTARAFVGQLPTFLGRMSDFSDPTLLTNSDNL
jgi:hypothetical protein